MKNQKAFNDMSLQIINYILDTEHECFRDFCFENSIDSLNDFDHIYLMALESKRVYKNGTININGKVCRNFEEIKKELKELYN